NLLCDSRRDRKSVRKTTTFTLLLSACLGASIPLNAAAKLILWDTMTRRGGALSVDDRSGGEAGASDLLQLEAQPAKASSDPGYYGRDYSFKGDAVVENDKLVVVFWGTKGQVVVFNKAGAVADAGDPTKVRLDQSIAELTPLAPNTSF